MDPDDAVCATHSPPGTTNSATVKEKLLRGNKKKKKSQPLQLTPAVAKLSFPLDSSLRELHPGCFCPALVLSWLAPGPGSPCCPLRLWPLRYRSHSNDPACCESPCRPVRPSFSSRLSTAAQLSAASLYLSSQAEISPVLLHFNLLLMSDTRNF